MLWPMPDLLLFITPGQNSETGNSWVSGKSEAYLLTPEKRISPKLQLLLKLFYQSSTGIIPKSNFWHNISNLMPKPFNY